jgi:hypothetical protein
VLLGRAREQCVREAKEKCPAVHPCGASLMTKLRPEIGRAQLGMRGSNVA